MQVKDTNSILVQKGVSPSPSILGFTSCRTLGPESLPVKGRATESHLTLRTACRCRRWHGDELRTLVEKNDWEGIKSAPPDPPERKRRQIRTSLMAAARAKAADLLPHPSRTDQSLE
jgi:hypothetical protein